MANQFAAFHPREPGTLTSVSREVPVERAAELQTRHCRDLVEFGHRLAARHCPPEYRSYGILHRHPAALASMARYHTWPAWKVPARATGRRAADTRVAAPLSDAGLCSDERMHPHQAGCVTPVTCAMPGEALPQVHGTASLGGAAAVLPGDPEAYTDLVDRVPAFKRDGQPADDLGSRPPERLTILASRATTGARGAVSAVTGIVTIVIGWALLALHKLDILSTVSRTP